MPQQNPRTFQVFKDKPCLNVVSNSPEPIHTPEWREAPREQGVLPKNTTQCPEPGLKSPSLPSRVQCTNHEATVPPTVTINVHENSLIEGEFELNHQKQRGKKEFIF